jgi:hypothetical protein
LRSIGVLRANRWSSRSSSRAEKLSVAVVGRGRQEELVLEVRGQEPEGLGAERVGGVFAPTGRGAVVGLVHDQQVELAWIERVVRSGQDLPEHPKGPLPLEEVDGGDQAGEVVPRVDVDAPLPPQHPHEFAADDAEVEPELVPHLLPPLDLERRRADDQDLPGPVADDQFQADHPGLDGLAQAHVVGHEQVDPGHLDGPDHRVKLVVLDVDARAERRLDVADVRRGGGPPADRIEEGVQLVGRVEAGGLGEGDVLVDPGARLQLPDDPDLLAEPVVLDGRQRHEGLPGAEGVQAARRQGARGDLVDYPVAGPDADELALLRGGCRCYAHCITSRRGS